MNQDKARDFFSGYYEGTLEGGLLLSFERALQSDGQLQAEYRAFERTMAELNRMADEEIEVPFYLSGRIAARIDSERSAQRNKPWLSLWLPRMAFGAVAAAALVGGVFAVLQRGSGPSISGSTSTWPTESINVTSDGGEVQVHYDSATARSLEVCDASGQELKRYDLGVRQRLVASLENKNDASAIFEIKVSDGGPIEFVTVPGKKSSTTISGNGTITEFARALSDRFQVPVTVTDSATDKDVSWSFAGTDAKASADKALDGSGYDTSVTSTGVLQISSK